jgi:FkbM family methyltransferase
VAVPAQATRVNAVLSALRATPATWIFRALTRFVSIERLRALQDRGAFRALQPILARGTVRMPFGLAANLKLATAYIDLGGAQTFNVIRGTHEPMVQEAMRRVLKPGSVFWDVGANIGFHSLVAACLVGEGGRVVSIDPEETNIVAVTTNARINSLPNISTIQAAATASSGPVEILSVRYTLWTRLATVGHHPFERGRRTVRGLALDDLLAAGGVPAPDLVKIDVEGGELEVLEGMSEVLREHRPAIIVEMHGKTASVAEVLRAAGYVLSNLEGPDPVDSQPEIHVLAQPRVE